MKFRTLVFISLFFIFSISGFTFEKVKNLTLSIEGIKELDIDCGAGYMKIQGDKNLDRIEVKATIVVDRIDEDEMESFIMNYVTLKLQKRGSRAVLNSNIKHSSFSSFFKRKRKLINLDIKIPKNLRLDIDDGSGFIEISDISGNIKLDDGSGSIEIEDVKGKISIDDGSGGITIKNVFNNVEIDDGSGELIIESINGNVEVDDGSGSIEITDIRGDVSVRDGSGSMRIYKIDGSVVVNDGSGDIIVDGVQKDLTILEAGSGGIRIRNIKGKVSK